tara:strand:+ start:1397 stop:1663 length:267 start_codon:yes stop_codon:yes gene_type:complete
MPLYSYWCQDCSLIFDARHSYKDVLENCLQCKSVNVKKHLGHPINKKEKSIKKYPRKGEVVIEAITDTFHEIKKEKTRLSKRVYKTKK